MMDDQKGSPESMAAERAITQQSNWRHCNKCFGLWWNGWPTNGACPAGGAHEGSRSWNFYLPANNNEII